jgi:hypothetical protein
MKNIAQFKEDAAKLGVLIPENDEAREMLERMNLPVQQEARESVRELDEAQQKPGQKTDQSLGPGWAKVPIPTAVERAQTAAFRKMGLTEAEAKLAASGMR